MNKTSILNDRFVDVGELRAIGIPDHLVAELVKQGALTIVRLGGKRMSRRLFRLSEVEAVIAARSQRYADGGPDGRFGRTDQRLTPEDDLPAGQYGSNV
jgi:hypothetical protein